MAWVPLLLILVLLVIGIIYFIGFKPAPKTAAIESVKYNNDYMGFSLVLPKDFDPYLTQRKDESSYSDLEIFVATSDKFYSQELQSYAKPVVIRVYDREAWDSLNEDDPIKASYRYQGIKGNKIYTIKFWDTVPADWDSKWNKKIEEFIISGFNIL
jgi:hypothetical protein